MKQERKAKRLTKKTAKELLVKLFGKCPPIGPAYGGGNSLYLCAEYGDLKAEMHMGNRGKTIVLTLWFGTYDAKNLYFDAESLKFDFDFAESEYKKTERIGAFEYMENHNYCVINRSDAEKYGLNTIAE